MGIVTNRRRVMGGLIISPYDEFGYIKDGKTFHLDGISVGTIADAWTDLVGGISFPIVDGVEHNDDHFVFADTHGYMVSNPKQYVNFYSTGTIEVVADCGYNMSVFFTGKRDTIGCLFANAGIRSNFGVVGPTCNITKYLGSTVQISYDISAIYINGELKESVSVAATNVQANYCIIGNGNNGTNRPFVGKIYSIRYYNRVLTEDERAHNYEIDRRRFNLGN